MTFNPLISVHLVILNIRLPSIWRLHRWSLQPRPTLSFELHDDGVYIGTLGTSQDDGAGDLIEIGIIEATGPVEGDGSIHIA